ncbi:MAG: peptidylprolyl isomerase [Qipengyuania sp.]
MRPRILAVTAALALTAPLAAQEEPPGAESVVPSPNEIVAQASAEEWVAIPAEELLSMRLADDREGNERTVIIQLMPPPFSQGWVENIRTLARAGWYDDITVNRVQDNYVVQWGDPDSEDPAKARALPVGLEATSEADYSAATIVGAEGSVVLWHPKEQLFDSYADWTWFEGGWPVASQISEDTRTLSRWPVHCYSSVGVGRGYSPDAGTGAELYTVIGHAPRHLDRNIALVGRIVEGIEHLSSLPRGSGALGFYTADEAGKRTPIRSIRVAADLTEDKQPKFEYLSTEGETFARYAEARANRRDPFFIAPAGGADICNIPVPVRRVSAE